MTGLTTAALVSGVVVALVFGGRFDHVGRRSLRWPAAVLLGVGAQAVAVAIGATGPLAAALVLASYAGLAAFAAANRHLLGMTPVLVGLALNGAVMAANAGMPVRPAAIAEVTGGEAVDPASLRFGPKHHLERPTDRLMGLADIIPLRVTGEVVSVGDIVLAIGAAGVVFQLMRPPTEAESPA